MWGSGPSLPSARPALVCGAEPESSPGLLQARLPQAGHAPPHKGVSRTAWLLVARLPSMRAAEALTVGRGDGGGRRRPDVPRGMGPAPLICDAAAGRAAMGQRR